MDDFKGKKLLLQGASRGNLGLIKTAKAHGVYVVMTGLGGVIIPVIPMQISFDTQISLILKQY